MLINKPKFIEEVWTGIFNGNNNKCAKALGMEPAQLHNFVTNEKARAGATMLGRFAVFCKLHNLDFDTFIILPRLSTGVDEKSTREGYQ